MIKVFNQEKLGTFSSNKSNKLLYEHFTSVSLCVFWIIKKTAGWWGFFCFFCFNFSSHRNASQTLVTFSHYWLIIITISSSQHVLIQTELRRRTREDRHVPAGCRLSSNRHWGAGPQQKRTRKRTITFDRLPTALQPMNIPPYSACVPGFSKQFIWAPGPNPFPFNQLLLDE